MTNKSEYQKAVEVLKEFETTHQVAKLKEATDYLLNELKVNPKNADTYFLLGYVFFVLDNYKLSFKYISFGEKISGKLPLEMKKFMAVNLLPKLKADLNKTVVRRSILKPIPSMEFKKTVVFQDKHLAAV
jgi:hypothetical protein